MQHKPLPFLFGGEVGAGGFVCVEEVYEFVEGDFAVLPCFVEGLVGGEGFAADASLIHADANRQRSAEGSDDVDWDALAASRRSVREYLDTLDDAAWGAASPVQPKFVSKSDPAAQWTGLLGQLRSAAARRARAGGAGPVPAGRGRARGRESAEA